MVVNRNKMQQPDTCVDSKDSKDEIKESLMFIKATDNLGSIQTISFSAHGIKNLYDRRDPRIRGFGRHFCLCSHTKFLDNSE